MLLGVSPPIPQTSLRPLGPRCDVVTCFQEPEEPVLVEDLACALCTRHLKAMVDTILDFPSTEGDNVHRVYARWLIATA